MVSEELLAGLNGPQAEAVNTLSGPMLIIAGPGSGKTKVLTHRIAALTESGVPRHRILAVTFTNKAALELRGRAASLVGDLGGMWVSTFHSACVRILRTHHEQAGLPEHFTILPADDAKKLLATVAKESGHLEGLDPSETRDFIKLASSSISRAKNAGLTPSQLADETIGEIWAAYDKSLAASFCLDFDDILLKALNLLSSPGPAASWAEGRFEHVMVDEYQDTNKVQERIVYLLSKAGNLCVVGDPDQSIYAFRGATPAVMESFTRSFPAAKVVILTHNYRSTPNVCAVSQAVIDPNPAPHRSVAHPVAAPGAAVVLAVAPDSDAEAAWVASTIASLSGPLRENAVLIRSAALSRPLEAALRRAFVPYVVVSGTSFYDRAEVRDALAYLRLVANPSDFTAFVRAGSTPRKGIGPAALKLLADEAATSGKDLLFCASRVAEKGGRPAAALGAFAQMIVSLRDFTSMESLMSRVVSSSGLREHYLASKDPSDADRVASLDELLTEARLFDLSDSLVSTSGQVISTLPPGERLAAFMENAALVSSDAAESASSGADAVQLMTIHAAKGKEFDVVFVPGLEENILPHSRSLLDPSDVAEERRLLFVATSRARKRLFLSRCVERMQYGDFAYNQPSRFLLDIPSELLSEVELSMRPNQFRTSPGSLAKASFKSSSPGRTRGPRAVVRAPLSLSPGQQVVHAKLGPGEVLEVDGALATLRFSDRTAVFDTSIAPLTVVS